MLRRELELFACRRTRPFNPVEVRRKTTYTSRVERLGLGWGTYRAIRVLVTLLPMHQFKGYGTQGIHTD